RDCAAADLPTLWRPARHPEILTAVGWVEGMKPGSEKHVAVRAGAPGGPCNFAIGQIERRKLSAHAELGAAVADQDLAIDDERSRLVSLGQTGRKREGKPEIGGVPHVDLVERTEPRARVVFRWLQPLAIVEREPAGNSRHARLATLRRVRDGWPDRIPDCTRSATSVEYEK